MGSQNERRLQALIDATADIVFHMSADWRELIRLEGKDILPSLDAPDPNWLSQFIPEEDQPLLLAEVRRALSDGSAFFLEHRVKVASGEVGWFRTRAVAIRDETGKILEWFGAAAWITEQRKQQDHLNFVIHELDHRVKNTLAMVQAIASRTFAKNDEGSAAHKNFYHRLHAIALANQFLTGTGGRAEIASAIREVLMAHAPEPSRLWISGPDVQLSPKTALAVTLAMNELGMNALHHGAWSSERGEVHLSWSLDTTKRLPLTILWSEKNGPAVHVPTKRGYGIRLIEQGLPLETNGDVKLKFDQSGVQCIVSIAPLMAA